MTTARSQVSLKRLLFRVITLLLSAVHRWKLGVSSNSSLSLGKGLSPWPSIQRRLFVSTDQPERANRTQGKVKLGKKQLLIDISELVLHDARSGIQRVVRSILVQLLQKPPEFYEVVPVYWDGLSFRRANQFVMRLLPDLPDLIEGSADGEEDSEALDSLVAVTGGDVFLALDLTPRLILGMQRTLQRFRSLGVEVYFVVHDILLVDHPEWFSYWGSQRFFFWLETVSKVSSGLVCVSQATADAVQAWLASFSLKRTDTLKISAFHLGADIDRSLPSGGVPEQAADLLATIERLPTFLMVGTVEPRKGHAQALEAFSLLWASGLDINLVIVGRAGWKVESLIKQLETHPQLGKRLFWLSGISDEYLEKIYAVSTALLAASEGEGFGLPLIEAARQHLPIVARELPVFKEVAGDRAFYFQGKQPEQLAGAIAQWIALDAAGNAPSSANLPWLTWAESTEQLLRIILPAGQKAYLNE